MIKKVFVILFVIVLCSSCGKKGDPVYKDNNLNSKILVIRQISYS